MPKRPLSAYNLFFRSQRQQLLGSDASSYPITDQAKRKHRKTHGKIGFEEMAKNVGQKWKDLDEETKSSFEREAAIEKDKYNRAMEEYNRKKRQTEKTGTNEVEDNSSSAIVSHLSIGGLAGDIGNEISEHQSRQNLLDALSSARVDRFLSGDSTLGAAGFAGLSSSTSTVGMGMSTTNRSGRMFLDDTSISESHAGNPNFSSRLLDMSFGSSSSVASIRRQQDNTSSLQQAYGNDALAQMMLMADDRSRSTTRRTTSGIGIENEMRINPSIGGLGSYIPDLGSSRDHHLSNSDSMSLVGSLVGGTGLQRRGSTNMTSSTGMGGNLRSADRRASSTISSVSLQASEEDLWEYYYCLLQEAMTVREELDRRSLNASHSNTFGSGSNQIRIGNLGGLSSLSSSLGNRGNIGDRGRGLPLPMYDDVNMPPLPRTQPDYDRQVDLIGRARQVHNHAQQQDQQYQIPQQRRRSDMDSSTGSLLEALETHAAARRISDGQRSSNNQRLFGPPGQHQHQS
jgi:HMG (high mobility group) box